MIGRKVPVQLGLAHLYVHVISPLYLTGKSIYGCTFKVADLCICRVIIIYFHSSSICHTTKVIHSIPACAKIAELASLPSTTSLVAVTPHNSSNLKDGCWFSEVNGTSVLRSAEQRAGFVTDSPSLFSCKPRAKAASTGRERTQLRDRSCQSKLQGSRTKGGSHVACNFLEAIKPTLFNSLFNTHAILSVKWSLNAQLPIQSWKTGMWKALWKIMMSTSADFSGWRGM